MKPSPVTICNQALLWLGQETITSLNDATTQAQWCLNNYDQLRDAVLEERIWTFNTVRAISTTIERDVWGAMFSHAIPLNWTSIWRVYKNPPNNAGSKGDPDESWRIEGNKILSYWGTVYLWGSTATTDEAQFPPMFVQALAARIAADAAIPFTQDRLLQQDMWQLYASKLSTAGARDGQQGANDHITQRRLVGARYSGSVGG